MIEFEVDEIDPSSTLSTMETTSHSETPFFHVLGLIRDLQVPVDALLRITRERIEETHSGNAKVLTEYLSNRAASKNGALAQAAGEAISAETVGAILGVGRAAVHKAKDEGRLLAYQEPGKRFFLFPTFQFEGAAVAAWVPELIEIVGNGFAALHFLTVERKSLTGSNFLTRIHKCATSAARETCISEMLKAARDLRP